MNRDRKCRCDPARGIGGLASEGFRNGGNIIPILSHALHPVPRGPEAGGIAEHGPLVPSEELRERVLVAFPRPPEELGLRHRYGVVPASERKVADAIVIGCSWVSTRQERHRENVPLTRA